MGELPPTGGPVTVGGQEKDWCCVGAAQGLSLSAWRLSILNIPPRPTHGLHSTPDNTPRLLRKWGQSQARRSPLLHRTGVTPSAPRGAVPCITAQTLHGGPPLRGGGQSVLDGPQLQDTLGADHTQDMDSLTPKVP